MLKAFQLRAARSVIGIGVRDVGLYLGVSRTIVSKWEQQPPLSHLRSNVTNPNSLEFFFKQHGVLFPDSLSVSLATSDLNNKPGHLTRFQLRAARAALSLTQEELATKSLIPLLVINYLESQSNTTFLNSTKKEIDEYILIKFFEKQGIIFRGNFCISFAENI